VDAPADDATDGEGGGEQLGRQTAALHHDPGVELDVGPELPFRLAPVEGGDEGSLHRLRVRHPGPAQLASGPPHQRRTGIVTPVDGVPEAHELVAPPQVPVDDLVGVLGTAGGEDLPDQLQRPTGRSTVQRSRQRSQRRHQAGTGVRTRRRHHPGGERRGVEAVVDRRHEVPLQRPHLRPWCGCTAHESQIVGDVAVIALGVRHLDVVPGRHPVRRGGRQRSLAPTHPPQRGDEHRDQHAERHHVGTTLLDGEIEHRPATASGRGQ
jgi:hypothetical protein